MKPLGLRTVLDSCGLNVSGMWLASTVLFMYGVVVNRCSGVTYKSLLERVETLEKNYPVNEGGKNLGVVAHEFLNGTEYVMRGYHIMGDDDDIAKFWADSDEGVCGIRGFDLAARGMYWTGMAPNSVFVPYLDIDEKAVDEADLHRVLQTRVVPAITAINTGIVRVARYGGEIKYMVLFNWRKLPSGLLKFSFHVHWHELGVLEIVEWKHFLSRLDLPPALHWVKEDGKWFAKEDDTKPLYDPGVYGGRSQLFRGPYCGKQGEYDSVLRPVNIQVAADTGKFRCFPRHDLPAVTVILQSRIARWPTNMKVLNFTGISESIPGLPRVEAKEAKTVDLVEALARGNRMLPFLLPLLTRYVLPAWQKFRSESLMKQHGVKGPVVPTTDLELVKFEQGTKPGVFFVAVKGDSYCEMDRAHYHGTGHGRSVIGVVIDCVKCTIAQSCFVCVRKWGPKYPFLHIANKVRVLGLDEISAIEHWGQEESVHQFLLDYHSEKFRFHRLMGMAWVYDDATLTWKTGPAGNSVVGKMIDELNRTYSLYIQAKKHIVMDREIQRWREAHPEAVAAEIEKATHKIKEEARKFIGRHKFFLKVSADTRKKIIDELRCFSIKLEVEELNHLFHVIPMKNGQCFNVFTGESREIRSTDYFTSLLNAELLPEGHKEVKEMDEWFTVIASGDLEKAKYMKIIAGYMFTMLIHDRKFYVLKGYGKNAKGLFKAIICDILTGPSGSEPRWKNLRQSFWERRAAGSENAEAPSPEMIQLMNRSVYYTDDMDRVPIDAAKTKRVVTAEPTTARTLYGASATFSPRGKVLWTTNFVPDAQGSDNAFWERVEIIPCLTRYVDRPENVDEKNYKFLRDDSAAEAVREKRDAFFSVVVYALMGYYKTLPMDEFGVPLKLGPFPVPQCILDATIDAREMQLPLMKFIREYVGEARYPGDYVTLEIMFQNYQTFLENMNERRNKNEITLASFTRLLSSAMDIHTITINAVIFVNERRLVKEVRPAKEREIRFFTGDART